MPHGGIRYLRNCRSIRPICTGRTVHGQLREDVQNVVESCGIIYVCRAWHRSNDDTEPPIALSPNLVKIEIPSISFITRRPCGGEGVPYPFGYMKIHLHQRLVDYSIGGTRRHRELNDEAPTFRRAFRRETRRAAVDASLGGPLLRGCIICMPVTVCTLMYATRTMLSMKILVHVEDLTWLWLHFPREGHRIPRISIAEPCFYHQSNGHRYIVPGHSRSLSPSTPKSSPPFVSPLYTRHYIYPRTVLHLKPHAPSASTSFATSRHIIIDQPYRFVTFKRLFQPR